MKKLIMLILKRQQVQALYDAEASANAEAYNSFDSDYHCCHECMMGNDWDYYEEKLKTRVDMLTRRIDIITKRLNPF